MKHPSYYTSSGNFKKRENRKSKIGNTRWSSKVTRISGAYNWNNCEKMGIFRVPFRKFYAFRTKPNISRAKIVHFIVLIWYWFLIWRF